MVVLIDFYCYGQEASKYFSINKILKSTLEQLVNKQQQLTKRIKS